MGKVLNDSVLRVWEIAQKNPYGFTVGADFQPITSGFSVAYNATQNSHGLEGLERVFNYLIDNNLPLVFGGWLDTETNKYYFDAVAIYESEDQAVAAGIREKQIAIFDLNNLEEIRLNVTA